MTSADWVWCYNYILNPANGAYANTVLSDNIAKVEAVDPYTVKFQMVGPRALFPHVLSSIQNGTIVPKNSLGSKVGVIEGNPPPGTGPFQFVNWTPGTAVNSSGSMITGAGRRTWKGSGSGSSRTRPPGRTRCAPATWTWRTV